MQAQRSTRKYCSDNCKQLSFYKRNGLLLAGIESAEETDLLAPLQEQEEAAIVAQPVKESLKDKEEYEHIYSSLINEIDDCLNSGHLVMFQHPQQYWSSYTLPTVKWVSIRLRCLLENLIRLSNLPAVNYATLDALKEAFNNILASAEFRKLPASYPYSNTIKELAQKITITAKAVTPHQNTRLRLTRARKASLIACRFTLAGMVPLAKFSDLNFKE
ncbi:hypothetical protein SAMN05421788_11582 [Filimonas lacunae]|uniref:Uncharacterized protein n=1 Tax=Filimonas lacunae TaxID=477680 RepID=A0A1N7RGZ8_9BACT|nr:hypothetical protein [Filimonas lacunae]SIT34264.1 hypothetical protein SAMN05421788_11582 [Filimonas lacunae]